MAVHLPALAPPPRAGWAHDPRAPPRIPHQAAGAAASIPRYPW